MLGKTDDSEQKSPELMLWLYKPEGYKGYSS